MQDNHPLIYALEGHVALLTLNRPEKRNALNDELIEGLKNALHEVDATDTVRAVVITGAGADFCSGADLGALQKVAESSISENLENAHSLMDLFLLIR